MLWLSFVLMPCIIPGCRIIRVQQRWASRVESESSWKASNDKIPICNTPVGALCCTSQQGTGRFCTWYDTKFYFAIPQRTPHERLHLSYLRESISCTYALPVPRTGIKLEKLKDLEIFSSSYFNILLDDIQRGGAGTSPPTP